MLVVTIGAERSLDSISTEGTTSLLAESGLLLTVVKTSMPEESVKVSVRTFILLAFCFA